VGVRSQIVEHAGGGVEHLQELECLWNFIDTVQMSRAWRLIIRVRAMLGLPVVAPIGRSR